MQVPRHAARPAGARGTTRQGGRSPGAWLRSAPSATPASGSSVAVVQPARETASTAPPGKAQVQDDAGGAEASLPAPGVAVVATQAVQQFASGLVSSLSRLQLYPSTASEPAQEAAEHREAQSNRNSQVPPVALSQVPVWELKHMRKLCHLTALTYKMARVTPRAMRRKHAVELVATSWACEIRQYEHSRTAAETMEEGDGMVVSMPDARSVYQQLAGRGTASAPPPSPQPPVPPTVPKPGLPSTQRASSSNIVSMSSNGTTPRTDGVATSSSATPATASTQPTGSQPQAPGGNGNEQGAKRWASPAEMVAAMVVDAAAAASAAAVNPIASAAGSLYAGLASLPIASALGAGPRSSAPAAAAAIMSAATAVLSKGGGAADVPAPSRMAAGLAAAAGPAAIAAAPGSSTRLAAPTQATTGSPACPSEWFVCDDDATATRLFVIQGSDTIDHWKLNLTFDPVSFEEPSLGIKVHRGAYQAAQILYDRFLPMVHEHLDSSPFAKICFTGHSIGGSLAVLLAMMYHHRGVLPAARLATVYTFGAPSIFCMEASAPGCGHSEANSGHKPEAPGSGEGAAEVAAEVPHPVAAEVVGSYDNERVQGDDRHRHSKQTASVGGPVVKEVAGKAGLPSSKKQKQQPPPKAASPSARPCQCGVARGMTPLSAVGLPERLVRNVVMARDIVPRAFACDYAQVADILKSWGPAFKYHGGLSHKTHQHLYHFTGRMVVMQPDSWHWFMGPEPDHPLLPEGPDVYLLGTPSASQQQGAAWKEGSAGGGRVGGGDADWDHLGTVLWWLMDNPHPLDILADPGAYMEKGSISRYHNPDNYAAALGRIIFNKRKAEGRIPSWVYHSYSRSLGMEAAEARGDAPPEAALAATPAPALPPAAALTAAEEGLAPWDSSDGDVAVLLPGLASPPHVSALESHPW